MPVTRKSSRHWQALHGSPITQSALVVLAVLLARPVLSEFSRYFYYLPAGARFAALLLLPRRLWPAVVSAEIFARLVGGLSYSSPFLATTIVALLPPLAGPLAVFWYGRKESLGLATTRGMSRLLIAMMISALLEATAMTMFFVSLGGWHGYRLTQGLSLLLGDFTGPLMIVPVLIAARAAAPSLLRWRAVLRRHVLEMFLLLIPVLGLFWLQRIGTSSLLFDYSRVLLVVPLLYYAFRFGWRGAAVATTAIGVALAPLDVPLGASPNASIVMQMVFCVVAAAGLMLGAAMDAHAKARQALERRNIELQGANQSLRDLSDALRDAARRKMQVEEEQRRRLAVEIHDELGQNLTAVHTRMRLATEHMTEQQVEDVAQPIYQLLGSMRKSVHGLMNSLRPPALDEFGLWRAFEQGPLLAMAENAGMAYRFRLIGEPALQDAMSSDLQLAVWRIAQESCSNAVRHSAARQFDLRLRIGLRNQAVWVVLAITDDGIGMDASRIRQPTDRAGEGLAGMRDRVLAFAGVFDLKSDGHGTRLRVLLRQPL